jgi:hypothetical protein
MPTRIKTITFLMKCLRIDIPIFKEISGISLRVPRVVLYKTTLIELMSYMSSGELIIYLTREEADLRIAMAAQEEKNAAVALATARLLAEASKESKSEPGFEMVVPVDETVFAPVTEQVQ